MGHEVIDLSDDALLDITGAEASLNHSRCVHGDLYFGFAPGKQIALALDVAASELYKDGTYVFKKSGAGKKDAAGMIELYRKWLDTDLPKML